MLEFKIVRDLEKGLGDTYWTAIHDLFGQLDAANNVVPYKRLKLMAPLTIMLLDHKCIGLAQTRSWQANFCGNKSALTEILHFVIDKDHRGQGYGKHFMQYLHDKKPKHRFSLSCRPNNDAAIALYTGLGYTVDYVSYGREPEGEDHGIQKT